jgi:hypothetical protein
VRSAPQAGRDQLEQLRTDGFFRIDGFADAEVTDAMLDHAVRVARDGSRDADTSVVVPEQQPDIEPGTGPEDSVSKIFRLARHRVFHDFMTSPEVIELVTQVLGMADVDNFLSQFIFKSPGAWGQPWHQDSLYFPFEPARPVIGVWLAVTRATLKNGCLHVLPGSHREPVHAHVPDSRPGANFGYFEIVDHDMACATPVLMEPGDLLVFDSHLMHRSTDNESDGRRAAMVYHFAQADTIDRSEQLFGYALNDWIPVARSGSPVLA